METAKSGMWGKVNRFWTHSIRRQLVLGVALVHAAMMTVFVFDLVHRQQNFLHGEALKQSVALAETLAVNGASWLLANDVVGLEEVVFSQISYPGLQYAMILDETGRVAAHTDPEYVGRYGVDARSRSLLDAGRDSFVLFESPRHIDAAAPIVANDELIGWARVGIDQSAVESGLEVVSRDGVLYTFAAIAVGALFAWLMARGMTGGLRHLVSVADEVRAGRSRARAHLDRHDELGRLAEDLNLMLDHLETTRRDLAASEQRFRDIAEGASDWFWEMDAELRFVYFSDRSRDVLGERVYAGLGLTRKDLVSDELLADPSPELLRHFDDLEHRRPFRNFEYDFLSADGERRILRVSGNPVFDEDGAFLGYRGATTDVTRERNAEKALRKAHAELEDRVAQRTGELTEEIAERKKVEEALLAAKENADAANRAKSDFLSNMSHELRTPLNAILGFTAAMQQKIFGPLGDERYEEYVDDVHDSGEHLLALINDVLDVSSIEAGKLELGEDEVDLAEIVSGVARMMAHKARDAGVALSVEMPDTLPRLRADGRRMRQIFLNLLSNGLKFTPRHGRVSVAGKRAADGRLSVKVVDTGVGMTAGDVDVALSRFGRVESPHVLAKEGTGLGLPLTKALVEAHGGTLRVESAPGEGTVVALAFPAERVLAD